MADLSIRKLRYEFTYPGEIFLHHDIPTITFRGAFGYALAQVIAREAHIPEFSESLILYKNLFMPENTGDKNSRNYNLARPFILRGWYTRPDKRSFLLDAHLFGCTVDYETFFDHVMEAIALTGIGPRHQVCSMQKIHSSLLEIPDPEPEEYLYVKYITPCSRLTSEGITFLDEIPFYALFARLLDRLQELDSLYGTGSLVPDLLDARCLKQAAKTVMWKKISGGVYQANRTSGRTHQTMKLDGFKGEMAYYGDFTPFRPYLKYLPYINLGHFNVFGCGWCNAEFIHKTENQNKEKL